MCLWVIDSEPFVTLYGKKEDEGGRKVYTKCILMVYEWREEPRMEKHTILVEIPC